MAAAALAIRASVSGNGDAGAVAQNIMANELLYRVTIAMDLLMVAGVVVLVWALYVLLSTVDKDLARLAAFFRAIEVVILAGAAGALMLALRVQSRPDYLTVIEAGQLDALARLLRGTQGLGFTIGFVFLGCGSTIFAWLFLVGRYVPRWMAGWGLGASAFFLLCALSTIVFPSAAPTLQMVSFVPMGTYEVGLGAWLWIRGADPGMAASSAQRSVGTQAT